MARTKGHTKASIKGLAMKCTRTMNQIAGEINSFKKLHEAKKAAIAKHVKAKNATIQGVTTQGATMKNAALKRAAARAAKARKAAKVKFEQGQDEFIQEAETRLAGLQEELQAFKNKQDGMRSRAGGVARLNVVEMTHENNNASRYSQYPQKGEEGYETGSDTESEEE
ncbi:hypothetical protein HETIRDRAFT_427617 [Heterobasidion irregulare TC 32-1]|uniref:Uncharacterized protein n=1 Tax=Heterobasidion irregulare (strain TC 32-1) TaxID=747525 RepID=W4K443_HETIT|nr:uncharacterized protein HETIRDRAFT_427617 [Heterobasidion irregulare TC 32-1]ETW80613.1 hypothetical protein HETIRDRAFT_427617 [Heterobasidion irregulare TC 32-1]